MFMNQPAAHENREAADLVHSIRDGDARVEAERTFLEVLRDDPGMFGIHKGHYHDIAYLSLFNNGEINDNEVDDLIHTIALRALGHKHHMMQVSALFGRTQHRIADEEKNALNRAVKVSKDLYDSAMHDLVVISLLTAEDPYHPPGLEQAVIAGLGIHHKHRHREDDDDEAARAGPPEANTTRPNSPQRKRSRTPAEDDEVIFASPQRQRSPTAEVIYVNSRDPSPEREKKAPAPKRKPAAKRKPQAKRSPSSARDNDVVDAMREAEQNLRQHRYRKVNREHEAQQSQAEAQRAHYGGKHQIFEVDDHETDDDGYETESDEDMSNYDMQNLLHSLAQPPKPKRKRATKK